MDKTPDEEDKMIGEELRQAAHAHPLADERVVLSFPLIPESFPLIPEETPWEYGHRLAVEGFEKALRETREAESIQGSAIAE